MEICTYDDLPFWLWILKRLIINKHTGAIEHLDFESNTFFSLTCACSEIAESSGYEIFAVGYYGECFGGKDLSKFNPGSNTANDCINGQYQKCSMLDESDCSGVEWSEFVFGFPEDAPEKRMSFVLL